MQITELEVVAETKGKAFTVTVTTAEATQLNVFVPVIV